MTALAQCIEHQLRDRVAERRGRIAISDETIAATLEEVAGAIHDAILEYERAERDKKVQEFLQ